MTGITQSTPESTQAVAGQLGRYSHQSWWPKTEMTTSFEGYRIARVGFVKKWLRITDSICSQFLLCWATPWTMLRLQGSWLLDYQHLTVDAVEPNEDLIWADNKTGWTDEHDSIKIHANLAPTKFEGRWNSMAPKLGFGQVRNPNPFPYVESLFSQHSLSHLLIFSKANPCSWSRWFFRGLCPATTAAGRSGGPSTTGGSVDDFSKSRVFRHAVVPGAKKHPTLEMRNLVELSWIIFWSSLLFCSETFMVSCCRMDPFVRCQARVMRRWLEDARPLTAQVRLWQNLFDKKPLKLQDYSWATSWTIGKFNVETYGPFLFCVCGTPIDTVLSVLSQKPWFSAWKGCLGHEMTQ